MEVGAALSRAPKGASRRLCGAYKMAREKISGSRQDEIEERLEALHCALDCLLLILRYDATHLSNSNFVVFVSWSARCSLVQEKKH